MLSLAVAIGAATSVYAVVHVVMGPPPGIADPHRVLAVSHAREGSLPMVALSWPDYEDLYAKQDVFGRLTAWGVIRVGYAARGASGSGTGERVTGEYFEALGVGAALGRTLQPSDDDLAATPVAVISHRVWRQVFASDDRVIGDTIRINGFDYEIVGVAAERFRGLFNGGLVQTSVWLPMSATRVLPGFEGDGTFDPQSRDRRWVMVRGRLASHRTPEQAAAQVAAIARQLDEEFPLGLGFDPQVRSAMWMGSRNGWTVAPVTGRVMGVPDYLAGPAFPPPVCCSLMRARRWRAGGFKIGLITNGAVLMQSAKLRCLALMTLFDAVLISDAEGIRKPDPRIFHRALDRLGTEPARAVFVGDHPDVDVAGARGAGIKAIWRRDPTVSSPVDADAVIHELRELVELAGLAISGGATGSGSPGSLIVPG